MNYSLNLTSLLYDVITYSTIIILLYYLFKRKIISINDFILLSLFCVTPFFFNNILFDWTQFPDQAKYSRGANNFRNGDILTNLKQPLFQYSYQQSTNSSVYVSSLLFALFPVISFTSINTVAFINKFLVVYLFIFFKDKKVSKFFLYSLIFFPSIIIYSSLSLRDLGVVFIMLMFSYRVLKGDFDLITLLLLVILFLIKSQNAVALIVILAVFKIFFEHKNYTLSIIITLAGLLFLTIYGNQILEQLNNYRYGFYSEYNGYDEILNIFYNIDRELTWSLNTIYLSFFQYLQTFLYPLTDDLNPIKAIFFIDNILFSILFFLNCLVLYKKNKQYVIFWFVTYIVINTLISLISINEMTLLRYKMPWVMFFIFCLTYTCNNKKIKPKI